MARARAVMVLGTGSGAGKSWLTTALCRWYARQGLQVAPYKAQNMSNNARVVKGVAGRPGEIGSAQYFQSLAARRVPDVRMNPVLLKPERDTASQVVVMGEVRPDLAAIPWRERSDALWPHARTALDALMAEHEVVVIEGAGSPAEINLAASDYVNLHTAAHVQAASLLVCDIDRGGAFAHLYGTHQLMPPTQRSLLRGFVLNRFRGDAALLAPGPARLQELTGVPTVAVLPMWREHGLPEEDCVFDDTGRGAGGLQIAVIAYPRVSNLDEFQPLRQLPGVQLRWARQPRDLEGADWIVLPGSKHTSGDLAWLHAQGLADRIVAHAAAGGRVLGVCGGLQMLGDALQDPHGVDGEGEGLHLLPLTTRFSEHKLLREGELRFGALRGEWSPLAGMPWPAYEIRHGRTQANGDVDVALTNADGEAIGWQLGGVLGICAHGLFESPAVLRTLFGAEPRPLDAVFDGLADLIDRRFEPGVLKGLLSQVTAA
jgi:adenosylcobyric acid synthase